MSGRHHPLYLFNTSICCVTHAILMHADPLLVSCSFRGAVVTAVFAAVATLRNLERVGTSCQSTASHGQRPVTPCAISLDLLIVSLACHQQPLFSQQFGSTKKSNFDRAGLAFRVDVCSHVWRSFLSQ